MLPSITTRQAAPKPPASDKQSSFFKTHYQTMLDFASKRIKDEDACTALVRRCFSVLFVEDPKLSKPIDAMIRLFEIIDEQCGLTASTTSIIKGKGKLLEILSKSA